MTEAKAKHNFPVYIPPYCTPAIPSRSELHRAYGGKVYNYDFDIGNRLYVSDVEKRILSDRRFDYCCKRNIAGREFRKKHSMEGLH